MSLLEMMLSADPESTCTLPMHVEPMYPV